MSGLAEVERICRDHEVRYERHAEELVIDGRGIFRNVRYPLLVVPYLGHMLATVKLAPASALVEDAAKLTATLQRGFSNKVQVSFDPEEGCFYLAHHFAADTTHRSLSFFVAVCDIAFPLLTQVSKIGRWDGHLVNLAFMGDESFPSTTLM